nr:MAG: signal peptidase II [Pseudomonadota bacterium]
MRMNEKKPVRSSWSRLVLFGTMALAGSGCDLKTKAWAEQVLPAHPQGTLPVVEPWVELTLAYNHGTAFSLVPNMGSASFFFGIFALLLAAGLFATILFTRVGRLEALALGTIAGGGIGNGIERLTGNGVVDFIKINYPWGGSWPLFNVADVLIVVGVALLFLIPRKKREPSSA